MFTLVKRKDRVFYTATEIKQVLEAILNDFHPVYSGESQQEVSQIELMRVIVGRVADGLDLSLDIPEASVIGKRNL